ncbi:MAG TPA: hypothetical protein VLN57_13435 [Xanthobacteraceae bacterium]|nr:hypothetical protein [Xanthobacteraceae bacterium]
MSAAAHWSRSLPPGKFRLTAPEPLEADIHESCARVLDRLLLPPAFWFAMPIGHIQLMPAQMARLARIGLKRGLPDIFVLYGGLYAIEIKARGGQLSKTRVGRTRRGSPRVYEGQEDVFPRLLETGAVEAIAICTSVDEVLAQLARWQIPLRRFT